MRIALVSSRYPPDAWGGAPIVVQRLAHGFLDRGHDVCVFAGAVNAAGRAPGECWDDADERGIPIRWMEVSRWDALRDERNFNNPDADARFAEFLAHHHVDLVHLHVPQGFGGGLLRVAAEAGVRVVLTMHDWWWFCARQFLMDKSGRRCSPVVDAGTCECEVSRAWLADRRALLDEQLAHVDMFLAPSATTAACFAANGLDPKLLRVDENGLPPVAGAENATPHESIKRESDTLRFLFVGASSYVKGVDIVFRAAKMLAGLPGWSLDAYGSDGYVRRERTDLSRLPARVLPPYVPSEIGRVLDGAEVLLVPTITSESHSIITREALQHGLPVIASDCWGPEEVIEHGRNGLIVPSGDAEALAAAMRSLVRDRKLLKEMQSNCGDVTIRSVDEQVEGLLAIYQELLDEKRVMPEEVEG
jgi:glycosyltransferase involved in cell wall biosynthesis